MEQQYHIIDKQLQRLTDETPCCIEKLKDEIIVCSTCKEWTGILDSCCDVVEPDLCGHCYERWIDGDYD